MKNGCTSHTYLSNIPPFSTEQWWWEKEYQPTTNIIHGNSVQKYSWKEGHLFPRNRILSIVSREIPGTPYTETPIPILLPCHSLKNPLKYGNMLQEHLRQTYSHFSTLALESWVQGLWVFRKILEVISTMGQTKHDTLGGSLFLHYRKEINRELNSLVVFFLSLPC